MVIIIDDYGVSLSMRNKSFLIQKEENTRQISPFRVTAIHVRKGCDLSSAAILLAASHDIPILFFDTKGKVQARLWQTHFGSHAEIRRQQLYWSDQPLGLAWAVEAILRKAEGQLKVLKWLAGRVPSQKDALTGAKKEIKVLMEQLRGLIPQVGEVREEMPEPTGTTLRQQIRVTEAQIGRIYWEHYFDALGQYEQADKRTRRPAQDPLNALINYGYGMLYGEVESAVLTAGLDPHLGILHRDEYNRPAFVFDAIEPYRPWVDRLVAELAVTGEMQKEWFIIKEKEVYLRKEGKTVFIPCWYEMMHKATPFNERRVKRKDQIQFFLTDLAQSFLPDLAQSFLPDNDEEERA